jgi:hypothetical protein
MLGIWSEILWFRSTDVATSLWSMIWARRGGVLICGAFAAMIACIATPSFSSSTRWLIVTVATLAGAVSGLGIWEFFDLPIF